MNKTRIIALATVIAFAGASQASAGGLLGIGILGNETRTGSIVVAPSVGLGIGKRLCENVLAHPALQRLRRFLLATTDAAGLYARYGFEPLGPVNKMMQIHRPDIYTGPQEAP